MKRSPLWIAVITVVSVLLLGYLFVPIGQIPLPPQNQFTDDPDISFAMHLVSEQWGVSEERLRVFAYRGGIYGDKALALIDLTTLSSASIWIAAREPNAVEPPSGLQPAGRLHLLDEYIPQTTLEKAAARNFYTKGSWAQGHEAVISDLDSGIPIGTIQVNSLTMGELRIPTLLSFPLFFLAVHLDRY